MATNTGQWVKGSWISMTSQPQQSTWYSTPISTGQTQASSQSTWLVNSIRETKRQKDEIRASIGTSQNAQRNSSTMSLYSQSLTSTSEPLKKQYEVSSKFSELASMIVQAGKDKWYDITWSDSEIVWTYLNSNPDRWEAMYNFTHWKIDAEDFAIQMGWMKEEEKQLMSPAPWVAPTAVWIWWAWVWAYGINKLWQAIEWWWDKLYSAPIDPSINEAKKIQASKVSLKDAEAELKSAKSKLAAAKKSWKWVKEAQQLADLAESKVNAAKWTKVRTVASTLKDYNVGWWITEWWTAESRWVQAKHEANQIFKQTIEPALEKSTAKVNVQNLINELSDDVERLAKNDPDKLKAYKSAFKDLKKSYSGKEFAEYSMKAAQTLKSWLQWRTPQKFWKGKEITNELQELKWILSTKLKNVIHSNLTKEIWEDSAKMYLDYANLSKYADDMAKASTNAWMKQWFGSFTNTVRHKLTDWAFHKIWLTLDKAWKMLQDVTNYKVWLNKADGLINTVKKNPKVLLKSLKAITPWSLVAPDFSYSNFKENTPWWEKLKRWVDKNWGSEITENEWKWLLGEEWYSLVDENWNNTLEDKWWTEEWILVLLDSLE